MTSRISPTLALQTAMYETMTDDATLMALITGVFDRVPESQNKPYVVIGESYETPDNAHDRFGHRTTPTLHIWSDQPKFSEPLAIANRILELFDHQSIEVDGFNLVSLRKDFGPQPLPDPNPKLRHVVLRFAIHTEETV